MEKPLTLPVMPSQIKSNQNIIYTLTVNPTKLYKESVVDILSSVALLTLISALINTFTKNVFSVNS